MKKQFKPTIGRIICKNLVMAIGTCRCQFSRGADLKHRYKPDKGVYFIRHKSVVLMRYELKSADKNRE